MPRVPPPTRTLLQSILREIAPVALVLFGAWGGILWTLSFGGPLYSSPPYLFMTGVAMAGALLLVTRGAPRWGYPWMAMGIVGMRALLLVLFLSGGTSDNPTLLVLGVPTLGPLVLAAIFSGIIANRSWGDSAFFICLYLAGAYLALPVILLPPESGAHMDIEGARTLVALGQAALMAAAVLLWNRDRGLHAVGALVAVVVLSGVSAGIIVPGSREDVPEELATFIGVAQGPLRIAVLVILITFALGVARRFISGRGILAAQPPPTHATEEVDDDDRASVFPASDPDPAMESDSPDDMR